MKQRPHPHPLKTQASVEGQQYSGPLCSRMGGTFSPCLVSCSNWFVFMARTDEDSTVTCWQCCVNCYIVFWKYHYVIEVAIVCVSDSSVIGSQLSAIFVVVVL